MQGQRQPVLGRTAPGALGAPVAAGALSARGAPGGLGAFGAFVAPGGLGACGAFCAFVAPGGLGALGAFGAPGGLGALGTFGAFVAPGGLGACGTFGAFVGPGGLGACGALGGLGAPGTRGVSAISAGRQAHQERAQQRVEGKVERPSRRRRREARGHRRAAPRRQAGEIDHGQRLGRRGGTAGVRRQPRGHAAGRQRHEAGAQHLVAAPDLAEAGGDRRGLEPSDETQAAGEVVGGAARVEPIQEPEALLRERHGQVQGLPRQPADRLRQAAGGRRPRLDLVRQVRQPRQLEQPGERQLHLGAPPQLGQHADGEQRMTAEREEAVFRSDPRRARVRRLSHRQHVRPQAREELLGRRARGGPTSAVAGAAGRPLRRRQRPAVHLAAGGQRQRRQHHEGGRQHVLRQALLQAAAQALGQRSGRAGGRGLRAVAPGAGGRRGGFRHHVGHQPPVRRSDRSRRRMRRPRRACLGVRADRRRRAGSVATGDRRSRLRLSPVAKLVAGRSRDHRRLAHLPAAQQRRLDLSQLDAEAADLHLVVGPPQVIDRTVREVARHVAGAIQARTRRPGRPGQRIGDEALRGQVRPPQVAPRQLHAADEQFARHPHRYLGATAVEQMDCGVGDRPPDRHQPPRAGRIARPVRHVHRGFRRPVEVVQRRPQERVAALLQVPGQRLAARHHPPQGPQARRQRRPGQGGEVLEEGGEHRRDEVQGGDLPRGEGAQQVGGVAVAAGSGHHQARASQERPEQLPNRHVEARRRFLQHPVVRSQPEALLHPQQAVDDAAVGVHGALGPPCRAGGIDHVGQAVRHARGSAAAASAAAARRRAARRRAVGFLAAVRRATVRRAAVQPDRAAGRRLQPRHHRRPQALLCQQHRRPRVPQHVPQALRRIAGVERQIGAARLQDPQ